MEHIYSQSTRAQREREMDSKAHAVCMPNPGQSHTKAMLKFAKLLHAKGFHITFVNTEFNHQLFLKSRGPNILDGLPDFQFKTILDSLPHLDPNTRDIDAMSKSVVGNFLAPFSDIILKLNNTATSSSNPPVTCIISDGFMPFTQTVAQKHGIPIVMLFTISASTLMGGMQFPRLKDKGFTPLKGITQKGNTLLKSWIISNIIIDYKFPN